MDLSFQPTSLWIVGVTLAARLIALHGSRTGAYVLAAGAFAARCTAAVAPRVEVGSQRWPDRRGA